MAATTTPSAASTPEHKTASILSVPPSQFARLQPHTYLLAHLSPPEPNSRQSVRLNGRRSSQFRSASVNTGSLTHSNGSAVVRTGDTAVVCGVRAEILSTDDIAAWKLSSTSSSSSPSKRRRKGENNHKSSNPEQDTDDPDDDDSEIAAFNLLVPNLSLNTGCTPSIPAGAPPSPLAQSLSHQLLSLLHSSRLVPAEDLRIWYEPPNPLDEDTPMGRDEEEEEGEAGEEGVTSTPEVKAFWTLYIDVLVISLAGNPFDAAWAAVVAALRDTRLPKAWWDMDHDMVLCSDRAVNSRKLNLRGLPISSSFCVFEADAGSDWKRLIAEAEDEDNGDTNAGTQALGARRRILADPDAFEESLCPERACVVVDKDPRGRVKILKLAKNGGFYVGRGEMRELVDLAAARREEWKLLLSST